MRRTLTTPRLIAAVGLGVTTLGIVAAVFAVIKLALVGSLQLALPMAGPGAGAKFGGDSEAGFERGIYFGWAADYDGYSSAFNLSVFKLAGVPCAEDDPLQEFVISGGGLAPPKHMPNTEVASYGVPLLHDREVLVTSLSPVALGRLAPASAPVADVTRDSRSHEDPDGRNATRGEEVSFSRVWARCRSWREVDVDIGRAGVLLLPAQSNSLSGAEGAADLTRLEAHVVPVPDRTDVLALLLLWNRTSSTLVVNSVLYAPEAVATNRVTAVAGTFEQYREWTEILFGRTSRVHALPPAPSAHNSDDLGLHLEPGGIALIALEREAFILPQTSNETLAYLGYPVIYYQSVGGRTTDSPDLAPTLRLALTTPLYAHWSPRGSGPTR